MVVKFATYNIQYGVGQDGRYDLTRTIEAVRDCDVICLQEVTTNWRAWNREMQPELLAKALNRYAVYAPAFETDDSRCSADGVITNARRGFGNMVLSRWPILYSRPHSLEKPPTEVPPELYPNVNIPRVALEVIITIDGTPLRVLSIHLSHLPGEQQRAQVGELVHLVHSISSEAPLWADDPSLSMFSQEQPAPEVPQSTLLFGDFNFEPDNVLYSAMLNPLPGQTRGMVDGWIAGGNGVGGGRTCVENDGRLSRLDYLFATDDLRANIQYAEVDQGVKASDHFPVFFDINIKGDN